MKALIPFTFPERERPVSALRRISVLVPLNEFKTFRLVMRQSRLEEYRVHSELSI